MVPMTTSGITMAIVTNYPRNKHYRQKVGDH